MTTLTKETVLQRSPNLRIRIDSSNRVQVTKDEVTVSCGPHGLAVLDVFSRPATLSQALKRLQARTTGIQDWVDLVGVIVNLSKADALVGSSDEAIRPDAYSGGYASPSIHVEMLNDTARTSSFLSAIAEVVQPGQVVVDVGTGTGVLAVAAAQAGARRVYALEASGISSVAAAVFQANELADRITLLPEWSTRVTLPESVDVIITEMIGHQPLGERVLEVTADAVRRFAKPDARLIPARIAIFGLPVVIPKEKLDEFACAPTSAETWHILYGMDLSPVSEAALQARDVQYIKPQRARGWKALSAPLPLAEIDFTTSEQLLIDNRISGRADTAGTLNGLLVYFELELSPTSRLSTHPDRVDETNHWYSPLWILPEPMSLRPGDRFELSYRYSGGEESCSVSAA